MGRKPRRYSIAHHKRQARRAGMSKHEEREHRKKSKVKYGGIGIVAKPLIGHKPVAYTKRYSRILASLTKKEEREHIKFKQSFAPRQWETLKMLLSCGVNSPEACEIAKSCDAEPA